MPPALHYSCYFDLVFYRLVLSAPSGVTVTCQRPMLVGSDVSHCLKFISVMLRDVLVLDVRFARLIAIRQSLVANILYHHHLTPIPSIQYRITPLSPHTSISRHGNRLIFDTIALPLP
jgi:hypothetical protein